MFYQKCSACNSEWNAIKIIFECPFCGNHFEIKKSNFKNINDAFAHIFSVHGINTVKQRSTFVSLLADYAPSLEKERRVVKMALDSGVYAELIAVSITDTSEQNIARSKAVDKLNKDYMLDKTWAELAVEWLVSQLNWSSINNTATPLFTPTKIVVKSVAESPNNVVVNSSEPKNTYKGKLKIGDSVSFGSYYFERNGAKQKIGWKILDIKNGKALLWSDLCLDIYAYHRERKRCDWSNSSLREWLRDYFTGIAFQEPEEMQALCAVDIEPSKNPKSGRNSGNVTREKVFILSNEDMEKYSLSSDRRKANATPYAVARGVFCAPNADAYYWVRTPGSADDTQMFIGKDGRKDESGRYVDLPACGIRPAVWVDYKMIDNFVGKQSAKRGIWGKLNGSSKV